MEYMTRGEYMNALAHALADRDVADADYMIADFKYYFFKQNSLGIGDTEIIQSLPAYLKKQAVQAYSSALLLGCWAFLLF